MSFWNSVKSISAAAGSAALVAGHKTKLHADIMLADREMNQRKHSFGVELYDHVAPTASLPSFWQAEDTMTNTIRPALLETQREIAALDIKRGRQKERINLAEVTRQAAFPTPAANFGEKVLNVGKSAGYAGNQAKLKTELIMIESEIKHYKQEFGVTMYAVFVDLEDNKEWLPTERTIRSLYDQTRRDLEKIELKKAAKEKELRGDAPDDEAETASVKMTAAAAGTSYGANNGTATATYGANNGSFAPSAATTTYGANNGTFAPPSAPAAAAAANRGTNNNTGGSFTPAALAATKYGASAVSYAGPAVAVAAATAYASSYTAPTAPSSSSSQASYDPFATFGSTTTTTTTTKPSTTTNPPGGDLLDFYYKD
jgi:hypothetical protein